MSEYYSIPAIAQMVNFPYHAVYSQIKRSKLPVIRFEGKIKEHLYVSHADLAKFFLTVDWLMASTLQADHPFEAERALFKKRYIHRSELAQQLGYDPGYIHNWTCLYQFPKPVVRNGWYSRRAVLYWLKKHRPKLYQRFKTNHRTANHASRI